MTSSKHSQAGVTLLELLISVTLVAVISAGMLLALRTGLNAMDKSDAKLMANRKVASVARIMEEQVANIMPVKAECAPAPENPPQIIPFFQGEAQAMRFASAYSLQQGSRGVPMILEFTVIPGDNGAGVRLVVNEHPYTGPRSAGAFCAGLAPNDTGALMPVFIPIQTGTNSFVLGDKLAYCRFLYRFIPQDPNLPPIWIPRWQKPYLPSAIRIEMAPLEADSARVQLLPLTIPVHVNRDPMKMDYGY